MLWSDAVGERRISVAMLARPATFSVLPGMARLLVVLDPIMVELGMRGDRMTLCRHDLIAFAGDERVDLLALDRPGRVLNLIARADRWRPSIDGSPRDRIGWMPRNDGDDVCRGDLVLDPSAPSTAIAIGFVEVDPNADIP